MKSSFAKEAKLQILETEIENDCCSFAFLSGLLHASGELKLGGETIQAFLRTDIKELFDYVSKIVKRLYGEELKVEIFDDFVVSRKVFYRIVFPTECCERMLIDTGIIRRIDGSIQLVQGIDEYLIQEECCKKAFVKGVFIGCATSSIKISENLAQKTSTGYHIEFTSINKQFLTDFAYILSDFNIITKIIERKDQFVLYVKDSSFVSDILALVDASSSVLALQNEIVAREMRNMVNRQTNCLSANISKTVEASIRQSNAIETIINTIGIESLSPDLQEVAVMRLANPEESLEELLRLSNIKLTKSGLNHRLRKIVNIANKIDKNMEEDKNNP
ncbi:MAG: DNA-binding protein WhiA [Clostridia bacterium]